MFVLVLGRSRSGGSPSVPIPRGIERTVSGGYGGGDIPVSIPNSAVKPTSADGTWGSPPGRVGRRRDFLKDPHLTVGVFRIDGSLCSRCDDGEMVFLASGVHFTPSSWSAVGVSRRDTVAGPLDVA